MKTIGFVTKTFSDKVQLEVKRSSSCGDCKACATSSKDERHLVTLKNRLNAQEGDYVELNAVSGNLMKSVMVVYMIPFAFLISGILLGNSFFEGNNYQEIFSFVVGMVAMAVSFILVKSIDKKMSDKGEGAMEMTNIL